MNETRNVKCSNCGGINTYVSTREFDSVCGSCGIVDIAAIFIDVDESITTSKESSYKYKAHWNEHVKTINCEDPPIPADIYFYIRLVCYKFWLRTLYPPQTKGDIKEILISVEIPKKITKKYVKSRPYHVHRRFFERWRTIVNYFAGEKYNGFDAQVRNALDEMFNNFVIAFLSIRQLINRRSLFHFDFLVRQFLFHMYSIGEISESEYETHIRWLPLKMPLNKNTVNDYVIIANKCHFNYDC
jgi:hypothetical protein